MWNGILLICSLFLLLSLQGLLSKHGQVDIDSPEYREAAAQRVGVKIPDRLPLRQVDHVSKYDLANKVNKMKGIAGMKAQLYGINDINVRGRQKNAKDSHEEEEEKTQH